MQPHTGDLVQFRSATRADLSFVAWCNRQATSPAPDFCYWDPLLAHTSTDTDQFLQTVYTHDALAWGRVEDFVVGEADGRLIAGCSGFVMSQTDYRPLRLSQWPAVVAALAWTAEQSTTFMTQYAGVWPNPHDETLKPSGEWTIECVAVHPDYQGQGIGKQLLEAALVAGRQQGHSSAGISVTIGNQPAEALYKAVGFEPYITYWGVYSGGAYPGSHKYRKKL
ncbi:GNAT family N-acetyltransferase [Spirosoma arcticum]